MAAPAARSQNMADLVGKAAHLDFDQIGGRLHQPVEPLSPFGIFKQIDMDPQRVFGIVNIGQKFLGDQNPIVLERDA